MFAISKPRVKALAATLLLSTAVASTASASGLFDFLKFKPVGQKVEKLAEAPHFKRDVALLARQFNAPSTPEGCTQIASNGVASYRCQNNYLHFFVEDGAYKYYVSQQPFNTYGKPSAATLEAQQQAQQPAQPQVTVTEQPRSTAPLRGLGNFMGGSVSNYAKVMGLYSKPEAFKIGAPGAEGTHELETTLGGLVAIGSNYGGLALEAEGALRELEIDKLTDVAGTAVTPTAGKVSVFTLMANGLLHFPTAGKFKPYLGAGVGAGYMKADMLQSGTPLVTHLDDEAVGLAYQGIAGGSYALGPQLSLNAELRYLMVQDLEMKDQFGNTNKINYEAPEVALGLKLSF